MRRPARARGHGEGGRGAHVRRVLQSGGHAGDGSHAARAVAGGASASAVEWVASEVRDSVLDCMDVLREQGFEVAELDRLIRPLLRDPVQTSDSRFRRLPCLAPTRRGELTLITHEVAILSTSCLHQRSDLTFDIDSYYWSMQHEVIFHALVIQSGLSPKVVPASRTPLQIHFFMTSKSSLLIHHLGHSNCSVFILFHIIAQLVQGKFPLNSQLVHDKSILR